MSTSQGKVSEEMTKGNRDFWACKPSVFETVFICSVSVRYKVVLKFSILNLSLLFPQTKPCS